MYSLAACWEQSPKAVKCAYAHEQMSKHASDNVIISLLWTACGIVSDTHACSQSACRLTGCLIR